MNDPFCAAALDTTQQGLGAMEAAMRRQRMGPNLLPRDAPRRWTAVLGEVLVEPMLALLLAAGAVYLLLGDLGEAIALLLSIVAVAGLTFYQALRSERALQALRALGSPRAKVMRDGRVATIAGVDVVVGDLLLLDEGDRVAADAVLRTAQDLMLDESLLTGESLPVGRTATEGSQPPDAAIVRASTLVVRGRGTAVVTAIGAGTAVGRIHASMRGIRAQPSPMQHEIRRTVVVFAVLGIGASTLLVWLQVQAHGNWLQALLAGLTLAIANIPEEFPVVLAVFLALGAWRLARQRALVRRAPAIETLGSITVLCTDKTGTLTRNRMVVGELAAGRDIGAPSPDLHGPLLDLLAWAHRASPPHPVDPMERAIEDAVGVLAAPPRFDAERVREYPFSPSLLASASLWRVRGAARLEVAGKGAPEAMLRLCGVIGDEQQRILGEVERMAARGMRVIGIATAAWTGRPDAVPAAVDGFHWRWLGLLGFEDPLRTGVAEAVQRVSSAGVRVLMLTGDHLATARAMAAAAGIAAPAEAVLASELDALDDEAYLQCIRRYRVFARMQPEQKLRLVNALRSRGEIVAMTGDGVNDAPSLLAAHVGIAMGGRGTDVAREAASIVLLDDDFVTIVDAIAAGRAIYDNIKRAVSYILAVHVPITGLALLPVLSGAPLILLPLHVVFLELIIDPASTLVFEREPPAPDLMQRPPRTRDARLLDTRSLLAGLGAGAIVFIAVACAYVVARNAGLEQARIAAIAFAGLVSGNLSLLRFNRAGAPGVNRKRPGNPVYGVIFAGATTLLLAVLFVPALGRWFQFNPPPIWAVLFAVILPWIFLGSTAALQARWRSTSPRVASTGTPPK